MHRFNGSALVGVVLSPFERMAEAPLWVWAVAHLLAVWQYLTTDKFGAALGVVSLAMLADYCVGAYRASRKKEWNPDLARSGAMSKLTTLVLLGLIRLLERLLGTLGLAELPWSIASMAAIAVILMELQSIVHHREKMDARPIPFFSALFTRLEQLLFARLPDPADRRPAARPPGGTDADVS